MRYLFIFCGIWFASAPAIAQEPPPAAPLDATGAPVAALTVGPRDAKSLTVLVPGAGPDALDLDLSLRQLQAEPLAAESLQKWVGAGGVVLLHTDAAGVFGLKTQPPRPRSREFAGQRFGRAVAALPFGAHPLLWAGTSQSLDGRSSGFLGVRTVFYQLRPADKESEFEGDVLVGDLGQGVPILRVSDVAPSKTSLYAAVAVSYGRGLALFCPRNVETARADGARFSANLRDFIGGVKVGKWVFLPWQPLQRAFAVAIKEQKPDYESLVTSLGSALQPSAAPDAAPQKFSSQAGLWLQREEAQTLQTLWQDAQDGDAQSARRGAGLIFELGARLALQQPGDGGPLPTNTAVAPLFSPNPARRQQLFETQEGGAHEKATRWWCGVFALAAAIPPLSTVPPR